MSGQIAMSDIKTIAVGAFLGGFVFSVAPTAADAAYPPDTPTLLRWCTSGTETKPNLLSAACGGYLAGISEVGPWVGSASKLRFCVPNGLSGEQLQSIFIRQVEVQPELLSVPAAAAALTVFERAFPCPETYNE